jgi:hypothetical protein
VTTQNSELIIPASIEITEATIGTEKISAGKISTNSDCKDRMNISFFNTHMMLYTNKHQELSGYHHII